MTRYSRDRLTLTLQLLAALPSHPTASVQDLIRELECPRSTFYRLIADLRHAGFNIERHLMREGKIAYYLSNHDRALVDRILRLGRAS